MKELSHLVVKPTYKCNQNCSYCITRKQTFKQSNNNILSLDKWVGIFEEAEKLGMEYLDISGGEPTLYDNLLQLIWHAKKFGWFVSMNTNGITFSEGLLEGLEKVCLDQVILSCISLDNDKNDKIRSSRNSAVHVKKTVNYLSGSNIRCVFHFIVSNQNYMDLEDVIEFCFEHNINSLVLAYPENAYFDKSLVLSEGQIEELRAEIIPGAISKYKQCFQLYHNEDVPGELIDNIKNLYRFNPRDLASGIYQPDSTKNTCRKGEFFSLVYANGDVLPCNGVEYSASPIVGNLGEDSYEKIWAGESMEHFRKNKISYCTYCPVPYHTGIAITTKENPPYTAKIVKKVPNDFPSLDEVLNYEIALKNGVE